MEPMYCPICKTELVFKKEGRYETLNEHVSCVETPTMKNGYGCPNQDCKACQDDLIWLSNSMGEGFYGGEYPFEYNFIDGLHSPFNTPARAIEMQVKRFDKEYTFYRLKIKKTYKVKADNDGNILSKKIKFELIIKKGEHWIYYTPGIICLFQTLKYAFWVRKRIKQGVKYKWSDETKKPYNDAWNYKVSHFLLNLLPEPKEI